MHCHAEFDEKKHRTYIPRIWPTWHNHHTTIITWEFSRSTGGCLKLELSPSNHPSTFSYSFFTALSYAVLALQLSYWYYFFVLTTMFSQNKEIEPVRDKPPARTLSTFDFFFRSFSNKLWSTTSCQEYQYVYNCLLWIYSLVIVRWKIMKIQTTKIL